MSESQKTALNYTQALGPEGLAKVLDSFLQKRQRDHLFANTEHYILYQLGDQKSLIKVDMAEPPFQFWHFDFLGRPPTKAVKETIARFLWEKGGERERFFEEFQGG